MVRSSQSLQSFASIKFVFHNRMLSRTYFITILAKIVGWIRLVACGCLVALAFSAQAAPLDSLHFENLGTVTGSNSAITSLIQDQQGFIWLGTTNGLFRHDGYEFIPYKNLPNNPNSLPNNYVLTLFEDNHGALWIGTLNGLAKLDLETNRFTRFTSGYATGLSQIIHKIISDGKGGMWLATRGGLQHFDPVSGIFMAYKHAPSQPDSIATDNINSLTLDGKGGLWLATWPGGLDYLAPGTSTFLHYRVDSSTQPEPGINNIKTLHFDSQQRLWIGSEAGLLVWPTGKDWSQRKRLDAPFAMKNFRVNHIYEDNNAKIWVATHAGLLRWDSGKNQLIGYTHRPENPYSLSSSDIYSVLVDRSGVLLIGLDNELSRVDLNFRGFDQFIPRDLAPDNQGGSNLVLSIAGDTDGRLWLGSTSGLTLMDTVARKMIKIFHTDPKRPDSLSNSIIYSLYKARDGPLWIGTPSGLKRLDSADGSFRAVFFNGHTSNFILHIAPGRAGILWLGTGGGLIRYHPASGSIRQFSHDSADPHSRSVNSTFVSVEDRANRVWVGGANNGGGLDVLDQTTGRFTHYLHDPKNLTSLNDDRVYCLLEDAQGTLWVGTGKGLNRVVPKPDGRVEFQSYSESELASDLIYSIQSDSAGQIWVSTSAGLFNLDPVSGKTTRYSSSSGAFNGFNTHSSFRDHKGLLYFGGSKGLTMVQPEAISINSFPPQVAITDITIFNRSLHEQPHLEGVELAGAITQPKALTLSWQNSVFSLEFSALHYANPKITRYTYRLEGFDKSWVEVDADHRHATYTNLNAGSYVFHVKASSNSGLWREISLPITITPPFWATWWFRMLVAVALLGFVAALYRRRIRQLKRNETRLEILVAERSFEAVKLRDEAMAASQAKSEFIANMSHEIRTPMNSILGMTHLALNTETSSNSRSYLEKIHTSGLHLLGIIEEILDFSKISVGKLVIENVNFDLGNVLESVNTLFAERVIEKRLAFVIDIDPSLSPNMRGDPLRLGQVLINYVSNAVKFTEKGSINVSVRKIDENESSVLVRFEVQDTGIGISDAEKLLLFQQFQQADASTTRKYGGTGLGLAISKQLVELMEDGRVGVDSVPGKGSTFWFSVRLGKGRLPQAVEHESATAAPSSMPAMLNGACILVADDHPLNQEVATGMLESAGAVVCIAQNGEEALDLLRQKRFDCVLLDIQMPIMDGFETARLIRANPALAKMPVIAMTANASKAEREQCLAAGMDDFISKPFNPAKLYTMMAKWLAVPAQQTFSAALSTLPDKTKWGGDPNIIDLAKLAEWRSDNKSEMREFALKFLALARQDMAEIESALEHGNLEALGRLGHHNKAPAMMFGAREFINLCQALEELSKVKGSVESAREIVSQMRLALDRINEEVDKELA